MKKLILSTVGTSLLTNAVQAGEPRTELIKKANLSKEEGRKDEKLSGLIEMFIKPTIKEKFDSGKLDEYKKISAELNGIIGIYGGELEAQPNDYHVLIATDTFQGYETAVILENFLKSKGFSAITHTPKKLSTENKANFLEGMKDLLRWFEGELNLPKFRKDGYEIIFNLTGGFKSLQGYLNVIGMFYADRITYIFETGGELLEIPKLPIEINKQLFTDYALEFILMSQELPREKKYLSGISETLLDELEEGKYLLSAWGELSWSAVKGEILSSQLLKFPYLSYEDSFKKDFNGMDRVDDKVKLQEELAKVSKILQESNGNITKLKGGQGGGLLYDNYTGKNSHIGHFRINQGLRASCTYENQILKLRHYGEHDYVNDNP